MTTEAVQGSPRRAELLASAYSYALGNGLSDMSLRPLAQATGTSPRVLLYLFGSKDDLIAEILAKARTEQLHLVTTVLSEHRHSGNAFDALVDRLWNWLAEPAQRDTIRLFFEAYTRSLKNESGPWREFAAQSVRDWIELLDSAQPEVDRAAATLRSTRALALLRGLLLDLLACEDLDRVNSAIFPIPD
ncbi:MAG: TetR/AcrR family transcriptional regulator [Acidimicrobiales bacterium]